MTTKAKLVSGLVAIFAAGLVVGGSVGFQVAKSNAPKPTPIDRREHKGSGNRGDFVGHVCDKLKKDLELSEEQEAQIKPIWEEASAELKAVNAENFKRVRGIFRAADEKMKPFLTTNQIQTLEQKNREREMRFKGHSAEKPPKC
jgi:Spy/CpxP family protein refolding chaperone